MDLVMDNQEGSFRLSTRGSLKKNKNKNKCSYSARAVLFLSFGDYAEAAP